MKTTAVLIAMGTIMPLAVAARPFKPSKHKVRGQLSVITAKARETGSYELMAEVNKLRVMLKLKPVYSSQDIAVEVKR